MRWNTACAGILFSLCLMAPLRGGTPVWAQTGETTTRLIQNNAPLQGRFLGLSEAVETALQQHPLVQVAGANLRAAQARTEQTRSLYYPQVYANVATAGGAGGINPRFVTPAGSMLRENLGQYAGGVVANQRLYDFGFTSHLVESSERAEQAQEQDVNARRALVGLNAQRAYLNSLKQRRLVQIAEETIKVRGAVKAQVEALYRQQLKAKLDVDFVHVELTNAESALIKARNGLRASFAELNRAMGIAGADDYVLEDVSTEPRPLPKLNMLIESSHQHPEFKKAQEQRRSAEARLTATKRQYFPTINAIASAGDFEVFDRTQQQRTGGWWAASAVLSLPLFTGFLIENQVAEARAQQSAADASATDIEQILTQQVTTSYLELLSLAQQIKLSEELVKTANEALQLARERYKLGLNSVIEVTQAEVSLTATQMRLAEAQYDYKIAEVLLAYAAGGRSYPENSMQVP